MNDLNDNHYIDRVLAGDNSAFAGLVANHKNMVFSIALKILHHQEDAEEVAQDAFLKAFRSLGSFERKSKFSTWLYRIAYNTAITKTRKKRPEFVGLDDTILANHTKTEIREYMNDVDEEEQKTMIDRAMKKLTAEENMLITLFYKAGNSVEEISSIVNLTESNVKVRLHRIRKKLYVELSKFRSCQAVG